MSQLIWQKSSFSDGAGANCVELAAPGDGARVHLRESDEPQEILTATAAALAGLIRDVKAGAFDFDRLS